jgi:GTPase SAR1 family protein
MSNVQNEIQYKIFNERKSKIEKFIHESIEIYKNLGMEGKVEITERLLEKVKKNDFKAIVIGEFKRGKSTFINALLGDEILPAFATPCTAVINEVKYGEKEKAVLHFKSPFPDNCNYAFREEVKNHVEVSFGKDIPPLVINVKDLQEFVTIPDPAKDQNQSVAESPYSKVELFYPLELCKNGVEIIDSPGLNEHGTRTKVTTDYLFEVDAVLFVMSCQALASASELDFIENKIRSYGHEDIFFICNRFDQVREKEKDRLVSYAKSKLSPLTRLGEAGVFFISAADALDGKLDNMPELIEKSKMPDFEKRLAGFFTNDRGKVKLSQPLKELLSGHKEVIKNHIPMQLKMLEKSTEEIEKKYEEALPRLKEAEHRRDQILKRINLGRERLRNDVKNHTIIKIKEISDKIMEWANDYEPENEFDFIGGGSSKKQVEALSQEVVNHLSKKFEVVQDEWAQKELTPLVAKHFDEIKSNIDDSIELFIKDIENVKADISDIKNVINFDENTEREVSGLERVLAAAGGFVVGGAGSALVGATMGGKEMIKSLLPNIALAFTAILLGLTNPFILIPMLLGAGFFQGLLKAGSVTENTKKKVAEQYANKLREEASKVSTDISEKVFEQTAAFSESVLLGLNNEINSVKETVNSILIQKRKGEENVLKRKKGLYDISSKLTEIDMDMVEMINELAV